MLAPPLVDSNRDTARHSVLPEELQFYQSYDWCLNPYLTVDEAMGRLRGELTKLGAMPNDWRMNEVTTNIFLLSCGLLNCIEEYRRGPALRLPGRLAASGPGRGAARFVETFSSKAWSRRHIDRWREQWLVRLDNFLSLVLRDVEPASVADAGRRLLTVLELPLPAELQTQIVGTPTPFSRLDLTLKDLLALGDMFMERFPDRMQSILVVGVRTSGSYFAPLLKALLTTRGYQIVELLTIEPNKGVGRWERKELSRYAALHYLALVVDDPPYTSRTVLAALDSVGRAGFAPANVKFIAATHPAKRTWFKWFPEDNVITLPPERWYKSELLEPKTVELRLAEYFRAQKFTRVSVVASSRAEEYNARLRSIASDERSIRLKRIFEIQLEAPQGELQTKFVLAKSVGWGWFGYHAFLIGYRLTGVVPPILGLRDGVLYTEWFPQTSGEVSENHTQLIEASAKYVAARTRLLKLTGDKADSIDLKRYNNGIQLLGKALSRAYGPVLTDRLMQARLGTLLQKRSCPFHTLIDGNMHRKEWIRGPQGLLKTDFEHHGMGKAALNLTDPAYDLADTIMDLALLPEEERSLISQYITQSGDREVTQRLFMHKLLAGLWEMNEIREQLFSSPRGSAAQRDYHRRFMAAWNFLTVQAARHCGSLCIQPKNLAWRAPLVLLDIDGVIDRRLFGFPSTTVAGMKALSLLNAHEFSVALNTARSVVEVKNYCDAYSLSGGVAEHGSYLWDAVHRQERVLIGEETARQLEEMRRHLRRIPGVFLDERHQHSIRAFTYREKPLGLIQSILSSARTASIGDGALAPISTHIVHQLLVDLELDKLTFHHTLIDTAILSKEVDKGTGLVALRDLVLGRDVETIAVGDSEPDLAMFRQATRSFAPANIGCKRQARLLGCQIVPNHDQQGLLEIVRKIVHSDNDVHCERCNEGTGLHSSDDLFLSVLDAADQRWAKNLLRAILHPTALKMFLR